jgi:methylated-DNA-[protein]-cysteine S-methyltransferase
MAEPETLGLAVFATAIGDCGIAWSARGVIGVQLPEGSPAATRARLTRRFPAAGEQPVPVTIRPAVDGIVALLRGERVNLTDVVVDDASVTPFDRRVHAVARTIEPGSTLTYGEVAARLGESDGGFELARAVGQALGRNPFPLIVPCHRVLAAGGKDGGFSAAGGVATKRLLLAIESPQGRLFL